MKARGQSGNTTLIQVRDDGGLDCVVVVEGVRSG